MNFRLNRAFLHRCLHDESSTSFHITNGIVTFFILISVAMIPLHFLPGIEWAKPSIDFFDKMAVTIFSIEFGLRLWAAKKPLQYLFSFFGFIDFAAIAPFYLHRLGLLDSFAIYLFLRAIRLLKFTRMHNMEQVALSTTNDGNEYGLFQPTATEKVERIVQKDPLVFLIAIFTPLLFITLGLGIWLFFQGTTGSIIAAGICFMFAFTLFYKVWLDFAYDVIIITNRRVIIQDRDIFGVKSNDISYQAITNVTPNNRGILNWLFHMGTITIETAAADGTLRFTHAPEPLSIVRNISENRQKTLQALEREIPKTIN